MQLALVICVSVKVAAHVIELPSPTGWNAWAPTELSYTLKAKFLLAPVSTPFIGTI